MALSRVSSADWDMYAALMRDAHETFAQKPITWKQSKGGLDRFMEDNNTETFNSIPLKVLLEFNVRRTWPVDNEYDFGAEDDESILVIINKKYLDELGFINSNGNFIFDPKADRFIIDGFTYRSRGITDTSQNDKTALWVMIIVTKEPFKTGNPLP